MPRTLLIGHPKASWRDWLRENRSDRDIVCLDPQETLFGWPARMSLVEGEKASRWRFYGSLDPQRFPHVLLTAACSLVATARDPIILAPPYVPTPLQRQVYSLLAEILGVAEIFVASGSKLSLEGWPVGPETAETIPEFPDVVQHAQRKAQWLEMLEKCSEHELTMSGVTIQGTRLGSGIALDWTVLGRAGFEEDSYGEVCGHSLLVVTAEQVEDNQISRLLDITHTSKAHIVEPSAYENLLCSFVRDDGEDFGLGIVRSIDFGSGLIRALCTAVPPAPVRVLRLGSLRLDDKGRELGETKPWQV